MTGRGHRELVRRARILHVEDEPLNRALLRAILERCPEPVIRDGQLLEAADIATARTLLAGQPVDLVLLDVRLSDGDGLDLLREIRLDRAGSRPAVIILSASVLPSEREVALAAGADEFLAKPYDARLLIERMTSRLIAAVGP